MTVTRPYDTLLSKGEDRRQLILSVSQRLLARNGWRVVRVAYGQLDDDLAHTLRALLAT